MSPADEKVAIKINVSHYLYLVCYVILYYDYVLTLATELQRFWISHPFSWGGLFFFLNRYLAVLGHIPVVLMTFWNHADLLHKFKICHYLHRYHQYLQMAIQLVVGVLLIMRVYALYGRSRWIVVFFISFASIDVGVACWAIMSKDLVKLAADDLAASMAGCSEPLSNDQSVHLAIAWSGQLAFDAIVFFLTLYKSLLIVRTTRRPLVSSLLRDGVLYFAILTLANLVNILTLLSAIPLSKGLTSTFVNIISATMMSRLMLNLRDPKIITPSTNHTITENSTTRLYPMISTIIDPRLSIIHNTEEHHTNTQGELVYPIEIVELTPPKQKVGSKT